MKRHCILKEVSGLRTSDKRTRVTTRRVVDHRTRIEKGIQARQVFKYYGLPK